MTRTRRPFQIFAKPIGAVCNLNCAYCYYLEKKDLYPCAPLRMDNEVLEAYIAGHIAGSPDETILFSWHGGEPTLLGLAYFQKIVALQQKHCPSGRRIANGIQTNGTLLDDAWCRFLAAERFGVGISIDGPADLHDRYRLDGSGKPTHARVMEGFERLQQHQVLTEILCVVNAVNVDKPLEVYGFFRKLGVRYLTFLPLVERQAAVTELPCSQSGMRRSDGSQVPQYGTTEWTVPADAWGDFLCAVFDVWKRQDIGRIEVQIFEETMRMALGSEHALCILRPTCGDVPVVEHNGDFYSCDHFVTPKHRLGNIQETSLVELIESPQQRRFGRAKRDSLPQYCRTCDVLGMCNGGCPKNRFIRTPDGEPGLNYLCAGYKRFFRHCQPFVDQVAALRREEGKPAGAVTAMPHPPGRNDPCPCGSGRKYKHCCLRK